MKIHSIKIIFSLFLGFSFFVVAQSYLLDSEVWQQATLEQVQEWLQTNPDVNEQDSGGRTALMMAARNSNDSEILSALIQAGADVDMQTSQGLTALIVSATFNQTPEFINLLVEAGADVNARTRSGGTVLMGAASYNPNPEIVKRLIELGANVNDKADGGITALMAAAKNNPNPEVVSVLLNAGADANAKDSEGNTATYYARRNVNLKDSPVYDQLADVTESKNPSGVKYHPLDVANWVNWKDFSDWQLYKAEWEQATVEDINELVNSGANLNGQDDQGTTVLMMAAYNQDTEVLKTLIEASVNLDIQDSGGNTALIYALNESGPEAIKALLEAGANVNVQREDGMTALILACMFTDKPEVVSMLLDSGADTSFMFEGRRAVDYARENSSLAGTEALSMLERASQ